MSFDLKTYIFMVTASLRCVSEQHTLIYWRQEKKASSKSKRAYLYDWLDLSYEFKWIITSYQSSVSDENKIAERIFEAEKTTSVWERGHQFRETQDFSHICFVSRHTPGNFVCVCWTKQLTPPSFLPCISVKLKRHEFANWVKTLLQIICKSLKSLTSDDCWGNPIWHVFQAADLDDVNVDQQ